MSFLKGEYYKATADAGGALTVGKNYLCVSDDPSFCEVYDDQGSCVSFSGCFAPGPVRPTAEPRVPRPVTAAIPACKCGKQAEKRVFSSFEYFFCPLCKVEVGGKAEEPMAAKDESHAADAMTYITPISTVFPDPGQSWIDVVNAARGRIIADMNKSIFDTPTKKKS